MYNNKYLKWNRLLVIVIWNDYSKAQLDSNTMLYLYRNIIADEVCWISKKKNPFNKDHDNVVCSEKNIDSIECGGQSCKTIKISKKIH